MNKQTIIYLHGFASTPQGTKGQFFGEKFNPYPNVDFHAFPFTPTRRDFEYMTITGLINRLRQYILDHDLGPVDIIGSSMGGIVTVNYAHRFGDVKHMMLLAPVLAFSFAQDEARWEAWQDAESAPVEHFGFNESVPLRADFVRDGENYRQFVPPAAPGYIIHGRADESVPISGSRRYAADYPEKVQLKEIDATHMLNDHLDLIWEKTRTLFKLDPA